MQNYSGCGSVLEEEQKLVLGEPYYALVQVGDFWTGQRTTVGVIAYNSAGNRVADLVEKEYVRDALATADVPYDEKLLSLLLEYPSKLPTAAHARLHSESPVHVPHFHGWWFGTSPLRPLSDVRGLATRWRRWLGTVTG